MATGTESAAARPALRLDWTGDKTCGNMITHETTTPGSDTGLSASQTLEMRLFDNDCDNMITDETRVGDRIRTGDILIHSQVL